MAAGSIAQYGFTRIDGEMMAIVVTTPCVVCGKQHEFSLKAHKFEEWQNGTKIQDALPELSVADREILISGTCDTCFNELFPPEPEDE